VYVEPAGRAIASRLDEVAREGPVPPKPSWRVTCCCGWERECSSEWAANSAAKLHPQLGPLDVKHDARVDPPEGLGDGHELPLT